MDAGLLERRVYVQRYGPLQRLNHWITAILFVLLSVTGLSLFYPRLYWLSFLFDGGEGARQLHPWLGVLLFFSFLVLAVQFVRNNIPSMDDVRWSLRIHRVMLNEHEGLPELGKYNAGQKGVYWSQVFLIPILLVTGLIIWQVHFGHLTSIPVQRVALLVHALAGALAITVILVHIYAGIWIKGTGRAMTRGTVTGGWAYTHHTKWLRDSLASGAAKPGPRLHGDE